MESAPSNASWPELRIALVTESRTQRARSQGPVLWMYSRSCRSQPAPAKARECAAPHRPHRCPQLPLPRPPQDGARNPRPPRSHSSRFPGCNSWRSRSERCCAAAPPAPPHPTPCCAAARHCALNRLLPDSPLRARPLAPDSKCAPPPPSPPPIGSRSNQSCGCIQSKRARGGLCILIRCWRCSVPDHSAPKSWLSEPSQARRGVTAVPVSSG